MTSSDWTPPTRKSTNVVVGVDAPQAWCIWQAEGIVACDQAEDIIKAQKTYRAAKARYIEGRWVYMAAVERPYGGSVERMQDTIQNAMSSGWWLRELQVAHLQWSMTAPVWRKELGIGGLSRADAKAAAVRIAKVLCRLQGIPYPSTRAGKDADHVSESICICLAAWLRFGLVVNGDLAHRYVLETGMPYTGGVARTIDRELKLESGYAMKHKPFDKRKRIQPLEPPAQERWYDDSPFDGGEGHHEEGPGGPAEHKPSSEGGSGS